MTELSAIAIAKARLYERVVDVEEQLRQNEKLSALGLLAAEVAHEIRNPLTVMKMLYHSLRLDFSPGDPRVRDDAILRENMDHLNKIVEQILDFARGTEPNPGPVNLNQLLDDLALLVRHKLRNQKIQFVRRLAPDLPQIMADPTQLAQAFLNLTLNAVEAMPKGGTLTISTRAVTPAPRQPPAHPRSDRIPRHRPGDARGTTPPPLLLLVEHDQTEGHRIGIGHCQPGSRDPSWKSPHSFPARPWHCLHRLLAGLISLKTRLQNVCLAGMNRTIFALALLLAAARDGAARQDAAAFATREPARRGSAYRLVTPVNQIVDPAGRQLDLPGLRPQALALSPDGRLLVTSGKTRDLLVIDPVAGQVLQTVPLPPDNASISSRGAVSPRILSREKDDQLSFNGLIFSPDGSRIYLSDVAGSVKVFGVDASHRVQALYSIPLPPANAPEREAEIPAGLALSADGRRLYVALNLGNGLAELDLANGKLLRRWDTGVAPYGVAVAGRKIYVSNWGGRRPDSASLTGPAGQGTRVRVDATRHVACEGSVTVIDSLSGSVTGEILVGRHASALALAPGGSRLVVANAASDTLSVIDTKSDKVVETICARQDPGDLFGASPNALAFDSSGHWLFVCNGSQNAVAVISFNPGASRLRGLVPVGWYPGALAWDARRHSLYVANIKGMSPSSPEVRQKFTSRHYYGSLTFLSDPAGKQLPGWTRRALANMRYPLLRQAALPPRPGQPPRPVPQRVGEPSLFQARCLYHQRESHLRPGAGRRARRQRGPGPLRLRTIRHPQPAQAGPRFCSS